MPEIDRYPERLDLIEHLGVRVMERTLPAGTVPLHWHEYYELELIISGSGKSTVNERTYPVESGSLFLLSPLDTHTYTIESKEALILNVCFNLRSVEDILLPDFLNTHRSLSLQLDDEKMDWMSALIRKMNQETKNNLLLDKKYIAKLLSCLLIEVIRKQKDSMSVTNIAMPESCQTAMQYMHRNFRKNITLAEIAAASGLSPNHLSEKFHRHVKVTCKAYLVGLRLEYALRLLEVTDIPIHEICYFSGFNTTAYFHRAFKGKYGISPAKYRIRSRSQF